MWIRIFIKQKNKKIIPQNKAPQKKKIKFARCARNFFEIQKQKQKRFLEQKGIFVNLSFCYLTTMLYFQHFGYMASFATLTRVTRLHSKQYYP